MNRNKFIIISVGIAALFFYALCWFSDQPTDYLWYIGIALPWLSLIIGILISFALDKEVAWVYSYLLSSLIFTAYVSYIHMNIISQSPYLATSICFIAYSYLSRLNSSATKNEIKTNDLSARNETQTYQIKSFHAELKEIKNKTSKIIKEQEKYNEEFDEVILLARNKVLSNFCKELLNDLEDYEKMNKDLYE